MYSEWKENRVSHQKRSKGPFTKWCRVAFNTTQCLCMSRVSVCLLSGPVLGFWICGCRSQHVNPHILRWNTILCSKIDKIAPNILWMPAPKEPAPLPPRANASPNFTNKTWLCMAANISSVLEFQRWWVLKSKIFGQESTYLKENFEELD